MQSVTSHDLVYLQKLPAVWCLHHKTLEAQLVCSKQAHVQPLQLCHNLVYRGSASLRL